MESALNDFSYFLLFLPKKGPFGILPSKSFFLYERKLSRDAAKEKSRNARDYNLPVAVTLLQTL